MSFSVHLGAETFTIGGEGDLGKFLKPDLPFILRSSSILTNLAGLTLADAITGALQFSLDGDLNATWDIGGASVGFELKPSAKVVIEVHNSGELFNYNEGDDETRNISVPVPPGRGYISLRFHAGIESSISASGNVQGIGISGSFGDGNQFDIVNHRSYSLDTPVLDAIRNSFQAFVWPFQVSNVNGLNDGDYLDYEFLGSLSLGFGLTYGVSGNLLGGRHRGEISDSLKVPFGKAIVSAKPTFSAAAKFALEYTHEDAFRVIVGRARAAAINSASLYLFRMDKSSLTTKQTAGVKLKPGAAVDLSGPVDELTGRIAQSAFTHFPDPALKKAATDALKAGLKSGQDALDGYVKDVNKAVAQTIQLVFEQDRIRTSTALFEFDFDFNQPEALTAGYARALSGDFVSALRTRGVTLRPGSAIENSFVRQTSVTFQFFDVFKITDVVSYLTRTTLSYVGAGTFRFLGKAGVTTSLGVNQRGNSCEVFFTAEASEKGGSAELQDLAVRLHFVLTDHAAEAARQSARALNAIDSAKFQTAALQIAAAPSRSVKISGVFDQGAYGAIQSGGDADARNYAAFVTATDAVAGDTAQFPPQFSAYSQWVFFNRAKNGTLQPDRKHTGNPSRDVWPPEVPVPNGSLRDTIECYVYAAQSFMNLCESLRHLARDLDDAAYHDQQNLLMRSLNQIISQNIPVFFIKPALVALVHASGAQIAESKTGDAAYGLDICFTATGAVRN